MNLISNNETDYRIFAMKLENCCLHWCNIHTYCTHDKEKTIPEKYILDKKSELINQLKNIIKYYIDRAYLLIPKQSSNIAENFNSQINYICPKLLDFPKHYSCYVDICILKSVLQEKFLPTILTLFGIDLSDYIQYEVKKKTNNQNNNNKRKQSIKYKKYKAEKKKQRLIEAQLQTENFIYKPKVSNTYKLSVCQRIQKCFTSEGLRSFPRRHLEIYIESNNINIPQLYKKNKEELISDLLSYDSTIEAP